MRAVLLRETGGPEQLQLAEVPDPEPGDGEVIVRVRAAGINFADVLVRQGRYPQPPELPTVPGSEVAGEVDGRRVMALPRGGGYAEAIAVDEQLVVPLPDGASFEEGAGFLLTFLTAWIPLTRQVRVGPGSVVLVHAGSGGVGSAAIQVAKQLGTRVLATASTEEKRGVALEQGADEAFGYDEFAEKVRADVVLDPVGGEVFTQSFGVLNPLGTVVAIGFAGGWWEPLDPAPLVGRNLGLQGFYLGRLMRHDPQIVRDAIGELLELWSSGAVKPLVGASFPLEQAGQAHELIESRRHVGKVVLVP
ncbi:MAG TPA: NADPH:quinone oxidoreductase family protein [Gaiellaceae bacterium]|nr:NADPH:quinone oxidoreductase family protein [Gaiellaceae bacterium]